MNIVNKQKVARARIQHRPPKVRLQASLTWHVCVCDPHILDKYKECGSAPEKPIGWWGPPVLLKRPTSCKGLKITPCWMATLRIQFPLGKKNLGKTNLTSSIECVRNESRNKAQLGPFSCWFWARLCALSPLKFIFNTAGSQITPDNYCLMNNVLWKEWHNVIMLFHLVANGKCPQFYL
jgi:hypothetical protein